LLFVWVKEKCGIEQRRGEYDNLNHDTFVYSFSDGKRFNNITSDKFKIQNFKQPTVTVDMPEHFQQSFYVL